MSGDLSEPRSLMLSGDARFRSRSAACWRRIPGPERLILSTCDPTPRVRPCHEAPAMNGLAYRLATATGRPSHAAAMTIPRNKYPMWIGVYGGYPQAQRTVDHLSDRERRAPLRRAGSRADGRVAASE